MYNSAMPLHQSLWTGSVGFCLVSTLVFSTVAFGERWLYRHLGVALTYALWTVLFILGGGGVVARLNRGVQSTRRSYATFALAFFLYAAGWIAAYFGPKIKARELIGELAGTILMGLAFAPCLRDRRALPSLIAALFFTNAAGYFIGRYVWQELGGKAGMIGWGVLFGVGMGLGLGYAFHACREPTRPDTPQPT